MYTVRIFRNYDKKIGDLFSVIKIIKHDPKLPKKVIDTKYGYSDEIIVIADSYTDLLKQEQLVLDQVLVRIERVRENSKISLGILDIPY